MGCWRENNMNRCRDCHFLAREIRDVSGLPYKNSLQKKERDRAKAGEVDFFENKERSSLQCYMGVWDEGVKPGKGDRLERVNKTKRDNCFFYPYDEGMMFSAAKELQKREQENKQLKRTNKFSTVGLWIAAFGLIAGLVFNIYDRITEKPPIKVEIQKQVEVNVKEDLGKHTLNPNTIENVPTSQSSPLFTNTTTLQR